MKNLILNNRLYVIGAIAGAVAGYFYWQQIGCSSGTCMITSKPVNSTIYGSVMGALLFGLFKKNVKQPQSEQDEKQKD